MQPASWLDQVEIRHLVKEDLPALEWGGEFTHYRRIYADAYERANTGRSVLWVAALRNPIDLPDQPPLEGLIGQLFVQLICDRPELADGISKGYIFAFRIKPLFRSGGVGSRMLSIAEADLHQRGYHYATLNVAKDNEAALRLYQRCGYIVMAPDPGRWSYQDEKGHWHFMVEPAWRMQKTLK